MAIKRIVIEIDGKEHRFTVEEARKLYNELDSLFGKETITIPSYPIPQDTDKNYPYPLSPQPTWCKTTSPSIKQNF
jgi:hypothetical protein